MVLRPPHPLLPGLHAYPHGDFTRVGRICRTRSRRRGRPGIYNPDRGLPRPVPDRKPTEKSEFPSLGRLSTSTDSSGHAEDSLPFQPHGTPQ